MWAEIYVDRMINGIPALDIFYKAMEHNYNVLVEGPTGSGKTTAALAFAAKHNLPFYSTPTNAATDPTHLLGKFVVNEKTGGFRWQNGPLVDLGLYGGLLLINEIRFLPERIQTVLFEVTDGRREITVSEHHGEKIKIHICVRDPENCKIINGLCHRQVLIIADTNPVNGYAGARELNAALQKRFAIQLDWKYDLEVEKILVPWDSVRDLAASLREPTAGIETPTSTDMLQQFVLMSQQFSLEFAMANLTNHFKDHERPAVARIIETSEAEITADLHKAQRPVLTTGRTVPPVVSGWVEQVIHTDWSYAERNRS